MSAAPPLLVDVWSDIVCPWCYVGLRHLGEALANLGMRDRTLVDHHAFQLEPTRSESEPLKARLERKFGAGYEQVTARVREAGARVGLGLDFEHGIAANSRQAHELVRHASRHGKGDSATELLMRAHFTDGLDIAQPKVLEQVAQALGLDPLPIASDEASSIRAEVDADLETARTLGIRGVPFFVFNRTKALSGAQPVQVFEDAIRQSLGSLEPSAKA
jgi:predicted DsbA family dithiol-disulfide isomerase